MDFVGAGNGLGLGSENGPILYSEPNRTSAIDDIRSIVLYVFIVAIFLCFFVILPGLRNDKLPTFICITTSLLVTSIIVLALFGTSWHVGQAPISAAYKAFSRDRIQGDLSVNIGLQSVNITLRAQKYYIHHATHGPMIMMHSQNPSLPSEEDNGEITSAGNEHEPNGPEASESSLIPDGLTIEGSPVDTELEVEEVFANADTRSSSSARRSLRSHQSSKMTDFKADRQPTIGNNSASQQQKPKQKTATFRQKRNVSSKQGYTTKRVNVDINYNERFYWIEPNQMRQEHQHALERGLPYPILTVVEYLSQDEAGFSWSRQYRLAGYYTYIILWLSICVCILMFILHCAAPKYGIYTMQLLGCLLLFANLTYATLVPRGEQKLVIPFEGQSLAFKFGWNFWLVLFGGVLSLVVGTSIVIIDKMFPNFIFTTMLDVDYDSHNKFYRHRKRQQANGRQDDRMHFVANRPTKPPFYDHRHSIGSSIASGSKTSSVGSVSLDDELHSGSRSSRSSSVVTAIHNTATDDDDYVRDATKSDSSGGDSNGNSKSQRQQRQRQPNDGIRQRGSPRASVTTAAEKTNQLFVDTGDVASEANVLVGQDSIMFATSTFATSSDSETVSMMAPRYQKKRESSVFEIMQAKPPAMDNDSGATVVSSGDSRHEPAKGKQQQHHYGQSARSAQQYPTTATLTSTAPATSLMSASSKNQKGHIGQQSRSTKNHNAESFGHQYHHNVRL